MTTITKANPWWRGEVFIAVLLLMIAARAIWALVSGIGAAQGVSPMTFVKGLTLTMPVLLTALLGGLIGTGSCSVMYPVIHFWMGYAAPVAVGTTLFAVIFTARPLGTASVVAFDLARLADSEIFLKLSTRMLGLLHGRLQEQGICPPNVRALLKSEQILEGLVTP